MQISRIWKFWYPLRFRFLLSAAAWYLHNIYFIVLHEGYEKVFCGTFLAKTNTLSPPFMSVKGWSRDFDWPCMFGIELNHELHSKIIFINFPDLLSLSTYRVRNDLNPLPTSLSYNNLKKYTHIKSKCDQCPTPLPNFRNLS